MGNGFKAPTQDDVDHAFEWAISHPPSAWDLQNADSQLQDDTHTYDLNAWQYYLWKWNYDWTTGLAPTSAPFMSGDSGNVQGPVSRGGDLGQYNAPKSPITIGMENFQNISFNDAYSAMHGADNSVEYRPDLGANLEDKWEAIANNIQSAKETFSNALAQQENAGGWQGKTHDAVLSNINSYLPELDNLYSSINALAILLNVIDKTIFQTKWYLERNQPIYQQTLSQFPEYKDQIDQAYNKLAQEVMTKVYTPGIQFIAQNMPAFSGQTPKLPDVSPPPPPPPPAPPDFSKLKLPPPPDFSKLKLPPPPDLSKLKLPPPPDLSKLKLPPPPDLSKVGGPPPPDLSSIGGPPPPDLSSIGGPPPPDLSSIGGPAGLNGGGPNDAGFQDPNNPNFVNLSGGQGNPFGDTPPPLPGVGDPNLPGAGGLFPPPGAGDPNLPGVDGLSPPPPGLGELSPNGGPGSSLPSGLSGLGGLANSAKSLASNPATSGTQGFPADALKQAMDSAAKGPGGMPEGLAGPGSKGPNAMGAPGAMPSAGVSARTGVGPSGSPLAGVPVAAANKDLALSEQIPPGANGAQGAPAGTGSGGGSPGGGSPGSGQRGSNAKEHKPNKVLRSKSHGELVMGEVHAVVPVIGSDQADQHAADDEVAPPIARTPLPADRTNLHERRREPRTVPATDRVGHTAGP